MIEKGDKVTIYDSEREPGVHLQTGTVVKVYARRTGNSRWFTFYTVELESGLRVQCREEHLVKLSE